MEEKLYNVREVGDIVGIKNLETVRRWVREGKLVPTVYALGRGGCKFSESEVKRFIENRSQSKLNRQQKVDTNYTESNPIMNSEEETLDARIAELERAVGLLSAELEYWKRVKVVLEGP